MKLDITHYRALVVRFGNWIDSIRVIYGGVKAELHGARGGTVKYCNIAEGDKIVSVKGTKNPKCGSYYSLEFFTANGANCSVFSKSNMGSPFEFSPKGQYLSYVSGTLCKNGYGSFPGGINFNWSPIEH